jgi:hypothetical protein
MLSVSYEALHRFARHGCASVPRLVGTEGVSWVAALLGIEHSAFETVVSAPR